MSVKNRLKEFIKSEGLTIMSFEQSIGASNGYVNSISKGIGKDKLNMMLENYPKLDLEWLLTGKRETSGANEIQASYQPYRKDITKPKGIPYYDIDFTASFLEVENSQRTTPDHYVTHPFFKGCDFIVRASGQSMAKVIKHGDAIGLVKINDWQSFIPMGEIYAIVTKNGFRMIKVITSGPDDKTYTLISKPSDGKIKEFPDQQIEKSNILSIFKVQASSHLF